jgi:hypothetical protein
MIKDSFILRVKGTVRRDVGIRNSELCFETFCYASKNTSDPNVLALDVSFCDEELIIEHELFLQMH